MFEVAFTIIILYMFIGIALFVSAVFIGQRHPDEMDADNKMLFDTIQHLAQNKPLELLCAILLVGIMWLPALLIMNSGNG